MFKEIPLVRKREALLLTRLEPLSTYAFIRENH